MKIAFAFLLFVYTGVNAQFNSDSVKWNLHSNNSVSDSTFCGKGFEQVIGSGITAPSYISNYQKITKPVMGWTNSLSAGTVNSPNNEYIQFPYNTMNYFQVACSTGVGTCYDYCFFMTQKLRLEAYRSNTGGNVVMKVYQVRTNDSPFDVGNITISSTDPSQPTVFEIPLYYGSMNNVGLRLYPLQGDDFYLKEVSIAGIRGSSLPVRFITFSANERNASVNLEWTVDLNATTEKFMVQRSTDGINFHTITTLSFEQRENVYKWTDLYFEGENYYRVKALDRSGFVNHTNIIRISATKSNLLTIFPNPVNGNEIMLRSGDLLPGKYTIRIVDEMGRAIFSGTSICSQPGFMKISIPKRKSGIFLLSVSNEKINLRQRIMIE